MRNTEKPGVMLYFDMLPMVERLSHREAGILLRAILTYGQSGLVPELPEKLFLFWPLIQMRLDTDDQRYQSVLYQRKYAAYCRREKSKDRTPMEYHQWLESLGSEADGEGFS